ncbi:hypothetical protein Cgig2_033481 [Carnegiea gigantea]|uniref:PB1-like domain-containing protein n=1 Tax=Carnegiea gigantea TaxID=171969 RepID=A0A9Q1GKI3_9CARY|nr:hypothetical protein Cgig2_033481 [Carnegiea gigantea]
MGHVKGFKQSMKPAKYLPTPKPFVFLCSAQTPATKRTTLREPVSNFDFHHGGLFVRTPNLIYIEGEMTSCYLEPDKISVDDQKTKVVDMGYGEHRVSKLHLRKPNVNMKIRTIGSIRQMSLLWGLKWMMMSWKGVAEVNHRASYSSHAPCQLDGMIMIPTPQMRSEPILPAQDRATVLTPLIVATTQAGQTVANREGAAATIEQRQIV